MSAHQNALTNAAREKGYERLATAKSHASWDRNSKMPRRVASQAYEMSQESRDKAKHFGDLAYKEREESRQNAWKKEQKEYERQKYKERHMKKQGLKVPQHEGYKKAEVIARTNRLEAKANTKIPPAKTVKEHKVIKRYGDKPYISYARTPISEARENRQKDVRQVHKAITRHVRKQVGYKDKGSSYERALERKKYSS